MIYITRLIVGPFSTNCYLIKKDSSLLVIDPGSAFRRIDTYIKENNMNLSAILLTHGHFDHIGAVDSLVEKYHCPVYLDNDDQSMVKDKKVYDFETPAAKLKSEVFDYPNDILEIDDFYIKVFKTPGHTNGSVCLQIENNLFTGDTLFRLGVGRTDLYGGSEHKLKESLQLFNTFDDDTIVYPGHDLESTIGFELKNNTYLSK